MKKFSRILGVGLTIAMLASVLVVANPVSVSAGTLTPSSEFSPPTRPAADVVDMDVAANGTTAYAVSGNKDLISIVVQAGTQMVAKSTNSGTSWSGVGTPISLTDPTVIGNLPATTVSVNKVAVAPDVADGSWVAIVATDNTTTPSLPVVYLSTDGGVTWQSAGYPGGMTSVTGLAVSGPAGTATHTLAVVGYIGATPKVFIEELGGLFGGWVDATVGTGVPTGTWNAGDFNSSTNSIFGVKFSPNYASDRTFVVVSSNWTGVAGGAQLQYANTVSKVWNGVLYGLGTGVTAGVPIVGTGNVPTGQVVDAALALAPTFFGQDVSSRVAYVSVATTAAPATFNNLGGVFRASNIVVTRLAPGNLHSVAVNKAGDKLVAGGYDTNDVVRVAAPATATVDTGLSATTNKRPALDYTAENEQVLVGFAGTAVLAGTQGTQSAFSRSGDDGKSFNDVSLIDAGSTLLQRGFATSADGSKIYVVTYDSTGAVPVVDVWRKTTAWERVLVMFPVAGTTDYIIDTAPENADVVFLAERNSLAAAQIYYTNDGGQTTWQLRIATRIFNDMAAESATTLYGLAGNTVLKSSDSGFLWDVNPVQNLAFAGANINVVSAGNVIVGGVAGQVAYSVNGTWTAIGPGVPGASTNFVAASGLASGNFIYAVTAASTEVYRWTVGGAAWTAMMEPASLTGNPTGIAYAGGTVYVVTDATSGGPFDQYTLLSDITRLYRVLTPSTSTKFADWSVIKMIDTTSPGYSTLNPATIRLLPYNGSNLGNVAGRNGFATTVGADGNPKLWGISYGHSNPATGVAGGAIQLTSFVDVLNKTAPAVTGPADASLVQMNVQTGKASSVVFTWTAPAGVPPTATYNLQVALDSTFNQIVFGAPGSGYIPIQGTTFIIGPDNPNSATTGNFPFQADTSYYWRVRVGTLGGPETVFPAYDPVTRAGIGQILPYFSTAGTARSFKIGALAPLGIQAPVPGATNVPSKPTFVWSPVQGATTYEIVVSDDPTFKIITFSRTTDRPNFASDEQLAYGTVYYWRVRASAPTTAVTPFANGIFTTEARPSTATGTPTATQPPITVTNVTPTITVELPAPVQAIPQFLLWIIIGIGAILVIALIVLIVRTRRVS